MKLARRYLDIDVYTAAKERIARVFDDFPRIYVSFSGGKDSGVLLELAAAEARRRGRRIGCLFVDLEAQYTLTIDYVRETLARHADVLDVHWVALPLTLRNAVSQFEPQWQCWDPDRQADWVRPPEPGSITDRKHYPFFQRGMEFEEFVPAFADWYADGVLTCCLVGIRTQESLNRWRSILRATKSTHDGLQWTTWMGGPVFNVYPVYDWRTEDIWTFYGREKIPYNRLYDRMHQAGLTIHQARICQPYGDDQRRGLWLFHIIEPATWSRIVARVNGANFGAIYAREAGNVLGRIKIAKPDDITWEEFAHRLLASVPEALAEHYKNKIAWHINWWMQRGYPDGIPDEGPATNRDTPSWTRVVRSLLRNEYWMQSLTFSPNKPTSYENYKRIMAKRRDTWQII